MFRYSRNGIQASLLTVIKSTRSGVNVEYGDFMHANESSMNLRILFFTDKRPIRQDV